MKTVAKFAIFLYASAMAFAVGWATAVLQYDVEKQAVVRQLRGEYERLHKIRIELENSR